jgi:hypothetical protein
MSAEKFLTNLIAAATQAADADKSVEAEASRIWSEITMPGHLNFKRGSDEAAAILALTQADVVEYFQMRIKPGGKLRSALISTIERGTAVSAVGEPAAGGAAGDGDEDGDEDGDGAEAESPSSAGGPTTVVADDKLAGGGVPVLPPGLELDAPLVKVATALDLLSYASAPGTPLSADAVAAAFSSAGLVAVSDALLAGEKIVRVQVVCATRTEVHSYLPVGPDLDTIKRSTL